ncbi:microtubule-associated tumor suppressor 1 homolog A isoform X1 [Channa argus]|uniref:microtubule-associated tumor suppressor 1 homolog A isoform X1 n=1 Tax=Channa argus TaxID=215402 RepID=UPI0035217B2B
MSNRTFNMSTNHGQNIDPLTHRGLQLSPSPESHYSNSSMSPSPDSSSSFSNLSEREADSPPDINILKCCPSEGSPVDTPYNITLMQGDMYSAISMNLNPTFISTPDNGTMNFSNSNLSLSNQDRRSEKYHTCQSNMEDASNGTVTSPDSAERELSSCELSWRGSTENGCYSLSSGEMVVRSNSFCLEDQSLIVVSSLEESLKSPALSHSALAPECNVLSTTPDVCEKFTENLIEENTGHPCLGMTFIQADDWELLTKENEMATSNSLLALPNENEVGLLMTFVCETSTEDGGKESKFSGAEAELLPSCSGEITPELGKTFVSTLSAMQNTDKDIHTSTPVQNIGNHIPSLPSFSESPCTGNTNSPGLNSVKQQPISETSEEHLVTGLPPSASNIKKMEIKSFPKSDFSKIKSKPMKRIGQQIAVASPASQHTPTQTNVKNKHTEAHKGATVRISPTKVRSKATVVSTTTKMIIGAQREVNTQAANLGLTIIQQSGQTGVGGLDNNRPPLPDHHPVSNKITSAVQCSNTSSEMVNPSQEAGASAQHAGNLTFCFSSFEKSPDIHSQTELKLTPKNGMSDKIEIRSDSAIGKDKHPVLKTRPRCLSDSASSSSSKPQKERRAILSVSPSFTISKAKTQLDQPNPRNIKCSSHSKSTIQTEAFNTSAERGVKKISLLAESRKSTTERTTWNDSKNRFQGTPSPRRTREVPLSQPLATSHRPASLSTKQKQGTPGKEELRVSRAVGNPQFKLKTTTDGQRLQATGEPSVGNASASNIKHQLHGSLPQTPTRPSLIGLPPTPTSRIPRKTPRPSRSLTVTSVHCEPSEGAKSSQVSGRAAHKPTPFKSVVLKARNISTPGKNIQPTLTTGYKPDALTSKRVSNSTVSPLIRTTSAKIVGPTPRGPVDKNKAKASSCQQHLQQQASQPNQETGPPDVVPASAAEVEKKNQRIQQIKGLLTASNCRFEAITIVLQQTLAKHDEAMGKCRELSRELVNLRGELACSIHSSECLEKQKEELHVALEDALQKLQEQHQKDLSDLEQRMHAFYQAEWNKVHLTYQEEANKCKNLMQQQIGELKSNHETMKLELQSSHGEQLQQVKQQYEMSLEGLRKVHNEELQSLDKTLKDAEAALSGHIQELTVENNTLMEKLIAEENKRKELDEKVQKDSHTLYLEQELESLKVVLEIKNKQLHQQEKKMMEIDKLTERAVTLDESLKKVQQENEDLKARMERHAALSRQLSTEQAMLQESLQKESKVNKRLSMENEELLWKLHNGDLSSPRKASPTSTSPLHSPSHSFSLQSPRSSSVFSSSPVSPR